MNDPSDESASEGEGAGEGNETALDGEVAARRQHLHEANNRLAAVIMNMSFARATLAACPRGAQLTPRERDNVEVALCHAEEAANQLATVIRLLG